MIRYYREPNGDYLAVNTATRKYYNVIGQNGNLGGRATAIAGMPSSVCTTAVGQAFIRTCSRVKLEDVPQEWRDAIGVE